MQKLSILACAFLLLFSACKKSADTAAAVVPERLEVISPASSMLVGATIQYSLTFYNNVGNVATVPASIIWSTSNTTVATVSSTGLVTAKAAGQVEIKATYRAIVGTALLTVVSSANDLASITISPAPEAEVELNKTIPLTATGRNNAGAEIPGLLFTWATSDNAIVSVSSTGIITGKAYGTSLVTASSGGIMSSAVMAQVIRKGNFSGMNSGGTVKLKIENNILVMKTSADFTYSSAPDLRIYLSNSTNVNGALEVVTLNGQSGLRSWNVPSPPSTIGQYRYAIIWCKQFGGNYGTADLGQ